MSKMHHNIHLSRTPEEKQELKQQEIIPPESTEIMKSHEIITQMKTNNLFQCCICLETMKEPISLPCLHKYCKACIASYFEVTKKRTCPSCRAIVPKHFCLVVDFTYRSCW